MRLRRIPFNSYYWGIAAAAALTVSLVVTFLYQSRGGAVTLMREQFDEQQQLAGRQTARGIEESFSILIRELEMLSLNPAVRAIDEVPARRAMEQVFEFAGTFHVNDIARNDARGIVRLPLRSPHLKGKDFSFREYFKEVSRRTTRTPAFEFLTFRGVKRGEKGVLMAMPVFTDTGEFDGSLIFIIEVNDLIRDFLPAATDDRLAWVVDNEGTLLSHPEYGHGTSAGKIPGYGEDFSAFLASAIAGRETEGEYEKPGGSTVFASATPIRIGGRRWSIVMETDRQALSNLLVDYELEHVAGVVAAVFFIVMSAFAAFFFVNRWNISQLRERIERKRAEGEKLLKEGTYETLVEHSPG